MSKSGGNNSYEKIMDIGVGSGVIIATPVMGEEPGDLGIVYELAAILLTTPKV